MSESESLICPNCSERSPAGYILCPYCGFDLTQIVRARERVRVTFKERFSRIWRSLFDPRESRHLFSEIGVNPDRTGAIIILYLLSVAFAMRLGALTVKTADPSWHGWELLFFLIAPWFIGIAFFILAFFAWLMATLFIWLLAKTLGGKAGFKDTLGIVGYSLGPLITAAFIINLITTLLGPTIDIVTPDTWQNYSLFEILYIPFFVLAAYHCGNGIRTAHLLNKYYAYGISGFLTFFYIYVYLLPNIL